MTHATFGEMLPLYVIGALDGDELYNFERYSAENRELCQAEMAEYQAVADRMALAAPSAQPSLAVYDRILKAIEKAIEPSKPAVEPTAAAPAAVPSPVVAPAPVAEPTRIIVPTRPPMPAPAAKPVEREGFNLGAFVLRAVPWAAVAVLVILLVSANGQLRETTRLLQAMTESYNGLLSRSSEQEGGITNLTARLEAQAQDFAAQIRESKQQNSRLRALNDELQKNLETTRAANKELDAQKNQLQQAADRIREQLEQQILQATALQKKFDDQTASLDLLMDPAIRVAPLTDPKGEGKALAKVYWHGTRKTGLMVVSNLTPVVQGQGKCLELWAICGNEPPVRAGIGWTDETGRGNFLVRLAKDIACIDKFAVTVEANGGVATPEGSIILIGQ